MMAHRSFCGTHGGDKCFRKVTRMNVLFPLFGTHSQTKLTCDEFTLLVVRRIGCEAYNSVNS